MGWGLCRLGLHRGGEGPCGRGEGAVWAGGSLEGGEGLSRGWEGALGEPLGSRRGRVPSCRVCGGLDRGLAPSGRPSGAGWPRPSWWPSRGPPAVHPRCVSGGPVPGVARGARMPLVMSPTGSRERGVHVGGLPQGRVQGHRVSPELSAAGAAGPLGRRRRGCPAALGLEWQDGRLLLWPWPPHRAASLLPQHGRPPDSSLPPPAFPVCLWLRPVPRVSWGRLPPRPRGSASLPGAVCEPMPRGQR